MPSAVTLLLMYICHLGCGICYWNLVTIFTYQPLHSWHVLWGNKIAIGYTQVNKSKRQEVGYGNYFQHYWGIGTIAFPGTLHTGYNEDHSHGTPLRGQGTGYHKDN